jgi:hypothetical protein
VNPQFHFASLVPDSQLPQYQETIRVTVREVLETYGLRENAAPSPDATIDQVDRDITFMFAARYLLESEVQRAAAVHRGIELVERLGEVLEHGLHQPVLHQHFLPALRLRLHGAGGTERDREGNDSKRDRARSRRGRDMRARAHADRDVGALDARRGPRNRSRERGIAAGMSAKGLRRG